MKNIKWWEWSEEAFEESKKTGKPILLSISAVWCHWCHVMDKTTYSNERVVEYLNEYYIPIRVDNDRNPEINSRYNMGGWPSTVFLTYNRDVLAGATYIPPHQFINLLDRVYETWQKEKDVLVRQAEIEREKSIKKILDQNPVQINPKDIEIIRNWIIDEYDPDFGGFGYDQKFPVINVLEFILNNYKATGNWQDLEMVRTTVDNMINGEMFDSIEGGMFRYATRRDWTVPHYEKMLDDNAGIAYILLDLFQITKNDNYLIFAESVFRYIETVLKHNSYPAYRGSQDADEEYFKADAQTRKEMSVPYIDTAVYTDSNALLAKAYIKKYSITLEDSAIKKAGEILSFFNKLKRNEENCVCHYYEDNNPHNYGVLSDQVNLAYSNLLYYEATADNEFLKTAESLLLSLDVSHSNGKGAYFDISKSLAERKMLIRSSSPLQENAKLAIALLKLSDLKQGEYIEIVEKILSMIAPNYEQYGIFAADYAQALLILNSLPMIATIIGKGNQEERGKLYKELSSISNIRLSFTYEFSEEKYKTRICVGTKCLAPVVSIEEISDEIKELSN
ncbi:MAG: DUF255 domain-containing protein [Armatimonadota bacterium]